MERVELVHKRSGANVTAGFRRDGALSIFFGADPVYQFNAAGELRRAFCDGLLVKATLGRLCSLRRERTATEVQLLRHELTEEEQRAFLTRMNEAIAEFATSLSRGEYSVVGQVPDTADVLCRLNAWLPKLTDAKVARAARL